MNRSSRILFVALVTLAAVLVESVDAQRPSPRRPGQRDTQQAQAGEQRERPSEGAQADDPIDVNFTDVPLSEVIASIGAQTGRNFDLVDAQLGAQRVTVISHHPVPPELAYDMLQSILSSRGFEMVDTLDGNLVKIVAKGQAREKLEIVPGAETPEEGYDAAQIRIVPLQYAEADEIYGLLASVGSDAQQIDVYRPTNTLIIRDSADGLRNIFQLIEQLDVPGYDVETELFRLRHTSPDILEAQISAVLGTDGAEGGRRRPAPEAVQRPRAVDRDDRRSGAAPSVVGQREEILRMVADERLNTLIVTASRPLMAQVRDLVYQLDTPTPVGSNNVHYVALTNADATEVEEALRAVVDAGRSAGADRSAGGGDAGETIIPFEKSISITTYEPSNALLILASPPDFDVLRDIIQNLDIPRRQVNIESIIMEVTVGDDFTLNVETAGIESDEEAFALSNVVELANAITLGPLSLTGSGGVLGVLDGEAEIIDPATGETTLVPNVALLMRALETLTEVEVLSQPNLMTVDNMPAEITVGQEIPIITQQQDVDDRTGFINRSSVDRRDVGVKMVVTPQINEGDYVSMELEVEVSQAVASPPEIGIDPNVTGATIQQSVVRNEVVIGHGQTGVIGGLIRESRDRTISQVPLLGDLPLLGWLFRNRTVDGSKQNLIVLVTPRVIRQSDELRELTRTNVDRFYSETIDSLFGASGFVEKVRRKHDLRKHDHPTNRYRSLGSEKSAVDEDARRYFGGRQSSAPAAEPEP